MKKTTAFPLVFCATVLLKGAPIAVPLPLSSPMFVSLYNNPVVTFGNRTIDFSSNISQQFVNFEAMTLDVSNLYAGTTYRLTLGLRARDGLASLAGFLPGSPDPAFRNSLPNFAPGITDLILFDTIISGSGTKFSFVQTDLKGATDAVTFQTPVPEPENLLITGIVLLGLCLASKGVAGRVTTYAGYSQGRTCLPANGLGRPLKKGVS